MQYFLKNQAITVRFDTKGAGIVSIKDSNELEYLWQGDAAYWSGQAPVMFPICGSLRNKRASIGDNMSCHMERHGVVRKKEFQLIEQTPESITFSICSDEELKDCYPFDFELRIIYTLKDSTITTAYQVLNNSPVSMPYFIGGHPAFQCPLLPGEKFEDYIVEFEKPETASCPESIPATGLINVDHRIPVLHNETVLALKHSYFNVDALIFDQLKSRSARLIHPVTKKGIRLDFADFDYFLLWSSSNNGPFLAMEPWSGISTCNDESDVFEEKRGVKLLSPGQSAIHKFDITIIF